MQQHEARMRIVAHILETPDLLHHRFDVETIIHSLQSALPNLKRRDLRGLVVAERDALATAAAAATERIIKKRLAELRTAADMNNNSLRKIK